MLSILSRNWILTKLLSFRKPPVITGIPVNSDKGILWRSLQHNAIPVEDGMGTANSAGAGKTTPVLIA